MTLGEIKAEALRLMQIDEDVDGDTVGDVVDNEDFRLFYTGMPGAINRALADLEARRILPLKRVVLYEPPQGTTTPAGGDTSSVAASATPSPTGEGNGAGGDGSRMAAGASPRPTGMSEAAEYIADGGGSEPPPYGDEQSREVGRGWRSTIRGNRARFMPDLPDMAAPARVLMECEDGYDDNHPYRFEAGVLTIADFDATASFELLYHPRITRVRADTDNATELDLPEALADALPYYLKADLYRVDEPGEANDARNWYEAAVAQYAATLTDGVPQGAVETVFGGVHDAANMVFGGFICKDDEI